MSSASSRTPLTVHVARALVDAELIDDVWVEFDDRVRSIGRGAPPKEADLVLESGVLVPGLVDLQLNGAFGVDLADADGEAWEHLVTSLPRTGVTSMLPTFISAPLDELTSSLRRGARWLEVAETYIRGPSPPARALGFHLEGPFLADARRGAHRAAALLDPSPTAAAALLDAAAGHLVLVTLAPERRGAIAAIGQFVSAGVKVAVGHSDASDAVVAEAADAGATMVTHLYNAQRPFHHRDPGVVGAALTDRRLTVGLIADGFHVAPTAIALAFAAAGDRIALVTDGVAALGMPSGTFELGGSPIHVDPSGPPRRADGAIAGAAAPLDVCIGNAIASGVDPRRALLAATSVPAQALGRPDLGRLEVGAPADLAWLDQSWRTRACWVAGQMVDGTAPMGGGGP